MTIVVILHDAQHIQRVITMNKGWIPVYVRRVPCNIIDKRKYMLSKSQVKYIQSLAHKKFRDEEGVFIAEGPKIVKEIINEIPGSVISVFALEEWIDENSSLSGNIKYTSIDEIELNRLSQLSAPNNVIAIVKKLSANRTS